jgi:hypothetical protein
MGHIFGSFDLIVGEWGWGWGWGRGGWEEKSLLCGKIAYSLNISVLYKLLSRRKNMQSKKSIWGSKNSTYFFGSVFKVWGLKILGVFSGRLAEILHLTANMGPDSFTG